MDEDSAIRPYDDSGYYDSEEEECPESEDGQHCECWYDGEECCGCGAGDVEDDSYL